MKMMLVVLLSVLALASAFPQEQPPQNPQPLVGLVRSDSDGPNADGSYSFQFETENGINRAEEGSANVTTGSFSYPAPDGTLIEVQYTAGVEGYKPTINIGGSGGDSAVNQDYDAPPEA